MLTHDRDHFFKYSTASTALKVIENGSFRWSTPTLFNDPFDHQQGYVLGSPKELEEQVTRSIFNFVYSDKEITVAGEFADIMRSLRGGLRPLPINVVREILGEADPMVAVRLFLNGMDDFNKRTIASLCHSRVFCVTEDWDNQVMWSHYAEEHRGVVFKLRCGEGISTRLNEAAQVHYTDQFVQFPDLALLVEHAGGISTVNFSALALKLICSKHLDWGYEKEWRVHHDLNLCEVEGDGYTFCPENPDVFEAVYLGCRMPDDQVANVRAAIREFLPATAVFRCKLKADSFGLTHYLL